jgi:uncharacterized protein YndB with AHSA1/START domain
MPSSPPAVTDKKTRTFAMSLDIDATPDDVWRALTDAGELMRWFPLQARVTPGKGGSVFWGWDDHFAWESAIDAWEPGVRLRLVENRPAFDVNGQPVGGPSRVLAMEFTIEARGSGTTLRIVHSGFGDGESWDDELDSVSAGWQFELRGLRHYLERHKGRDRYHASVQTVTPLAMATVWTRLLGRDGFAIVDGSTALDAHLTIAMAGGERIAGTVAWHNPERDLFVRVGDLSDGVFRLSTWRGGGKTGLQIWMVSYDARHKARVERFGEQARALVGRLFPSHGS